MRRTDKEILDRELISLIIRQCQVCRLGLSKDNIPYIVPVSFGYDGTAIYFHTAKVGRKLDFINANNTVCFEFEHGVRVVPHEEEACNWSFSFRSVVGYGTARELCDQAEKHEGMQQVMKQYSEREWAMGSESIEAIKVWKIEIGSMTGKQSKV
jgi:nitroimidazol reductase NimA-like FMN-containing flavoprotein (pyridoxamine 5'-phosphate oxidase superfamily)